MASAINKSFGGGYSIYTEKAEQGLKKPCFFVFVERDAIKRSAIGRYRRELAVKITYFPKEMNENREMEEAALTLCKALELITAGESVLRGGRMDWRISDGRMVFSAHFTVSLLWDEEDGDGGTGLMEEVSIGIGD